MYRELSSKIEELDGVVSCRITQTENELDEIHVISDKSRPPKKIVRDIETVTLVNLDREVSHKKISIARVEQRDWNNTGERIKLISIYKEHNRAICNIKLSINNEIVEKTLENAVGEPFKMMIARGMLELINRHINMEEEIVVNNVFRTGPNQELVLVQLDVQDNNRQEPIESLVGAVYVKNNLPLAIGKACLKALNRKLSFAS